MAPLDGQRWIFVEDSPFIPAHGGGEREHLGMLRAAASAGVLALVVLPVEDDIDLAPYREVLGPVPIITVRRRTGPWLLAHPRYPYVVASRPVSKGLTSQARLLAADATAVIVSSYKSRLIGENLARGLALPAILRMHNREGLYHRALAAGTTGPRKWALAVEARRIEKDERALSDADWLSAIADISHADATWRSALGRVAAVHVPPFAADASKMVPAERRPAPTPEVLFIGTFDVATNTDAVNWLLDAVWPTVVRTRPDASLVLVGRNPSERLRAKAAAATGVQLHGDVPEVAPFLERAWTAVNPAVSGSGVNIKLVEYMAAGLPLVSTSHATAGLPLVHGADLIIADDPGAFAAAILAQIADPESAGKMGAAGRRTINGLLDSGRNLSTIAELLQR